MSPHFPLGQVASGARSNTRLAPQCGELCAESLKGKGLGFREEKGLDFRI